VRLRLPEATEGGLMVFDASGRRVRTVFRGLLPAGERLLHWDGRDASGARVPPGLYVVQWRDSGRQGIARVAVTR
jgi:flagellar hook assembly protein FlgD